MATFVLIHGGGHGGWCYNKLSPLLRAEGHLVFSPSLTGCGDRKHTITPEVNLDTHITDVVNLLDYDDMTDVILVGHSYGGMVITGVADRAAHRLRELVYLDAAHPVDGESLRMNAPRQIEPTYAGMQVVDGAELVMFPMPGMAAFFGITDPADAEWLEARLTPHPWKCFDQPLRLTNGDASRRVRRTNINCTPSLQNSEPDARARQTDGDRNFEIDTGHDLMVTEPRKVADMLLEVARG
ncbi:MAG TPA: alpha/beta fold hydrolase [Sphingobium sp.]|uniref:alpha/beta fold hydrolase n=1 Tax=Sphingobium sp. TaxID=1912891 RepID=UPI002ED3029F